jgi:hypothetical protein
MTAKILISDVKNPPLQSGEELGVRSATKRQIEVTMFACGVDKLEGLKVGKLVSK